MLMYNSVRVHVTMCMRIDYDNVLRMRARGAKRASGRGANCEREEASVSVMRIAVLQLRVEQHDMCMDAFFSLML
jgi:hypothetical protein